MRSNILIALKVRSMQVDGELGGVSLKFKNNKVVAELGESDFYSMLKRTTN